MRECPIDSVCHDKRTKNLSLHTTERFFAEFILSVTKQLLYQLTSRTDGGSHRCLAERISFISFVGFSTLETKPATPNEIA